MLLEKGKKWYIIARLLSVKCNRMKILRELNSLLSQFVVFLEFIEKLLLFSIYCISQKGLSLSFLLCCLFCHFVVIFQKTTNSKNTVHSYIRWL